MSAIDTISSTCIYYIWHTRYTIPDQGQQFALFLPQQVQVPLNLVREQQPVQGQFSDESKESPIYPQRVSNTATTRTAIHETLTNNLTYCGLRLLISSNDPPAAACSSAVGFFLL